MDETILTGEIEPELPEPEGEIEPVPSEPETKSYNQNMSPGKAPLPAPGVIRSVRR